MREIFTEIFENQPLDPTEAARQAVRPACESDFTRRRNPVDVQDGAGISLDGRPILTPRRRAFVAPTRALAAAIAAEWDAQGEHRPAAHAAHAARECRDRCGQRKSRAGRGRDRKISRKRFAFLPRRNAGELIDRQSQAWDPVLAWAREAFGARFMLTQGVVHVAQPAEAVAASQNAIPRDPWRLAAVSSITTLTGSALLALAIAQGAIDIDLPGPPPMWTRTGKWRNGAATTLRSNAAPIARLSSGRRLQFCVLSANFVRGRFEYMGTVTPAAPSVAAEGAAHRLVPNQCPVGSPRRPAS